MSFNSSPTVHDINSLCDEMESESGEKTELTIMQKLQAIRLWQLKQQEELKKQQQTQLALLKSQTNVETASNNPNEEDDILAVPISTYSNHLETILEQSSILEESQGKDNNSQNDSFKLDRSDDPILMQIQQNLRSAETASPVFLEKISKEKSPESDTECNSEPNVIEPNLKSPDLEKGFHDDKLDSDVESSFEKVSNKPLSFDEVPVKAGKTFEEILAEQLTQEKAKAVSNKSASTPKRPFLRKGQGIARFNGPPKRPNIKKKTPQEDKSVVSTSCNAKKAVPVISHFALTDTVSEKASLISPNDSFPAASTETEIFQPPKDDVKPKVCVRKTARLNRRNPMKQLNLKPVVHSPPTNKVDFTDFSVQKSDDDQVDKQNDTALSDINDTVLGLESSDANDYNTTSNETFEQMEKFCNEHYADISTVKTLEDDDSVIMQKIEPLRPNKLMLRLFPSLRDDSRKRSADLTKPLPSKQESKDQTKVFEENLPNCKPSIVTAVDTSGASELLKSKLHEMESEIKRFQDESAKLSAVRKDEENQLQLLKQEFEEFQQQKEDELQRLNEFKKCEMKKLKKDRKLFEEHAAAAKSLPNKRDREYIQELESKINDLQNDFKLKEQRLSAINSRLRSQHESAVDENEKLKEKVKQLEDKLRKMEAEKEARKNKKSQVAWKAINEIVDSIPVNNENVNIDDYIQSHLDTAEPLMKPVVRPLLSRSPLVDRNDNNKLLNSEVTVHDGKVEKRKKDGSLEVAFQNGTKKLIFPDGTTQIKFINGDVKTVFSDGTVKYHYTVSGTWHTTHPNGMQVIEFNNKQVERHFPDGSKHITFEDGSSKMIKLNGSEETIFPDGTIMTISPTGDKTIEFNNGQREIHTTEFKRREYPDGTCKTVFSDGRQETKYSSGRLRIKDANGHLIVDKMLSA